MEQYLERNAYADHLVEVNKNNPVVTAGDICNELGALIVPQGTYVTEEVANKLSQFKLMLPLELQVNLARPITPNQLFQDIQSAQVGVFDKYTQAAAGRDLAQKCGLYSGYPLLAQKLTVLADRAPGKYADTQSATSFAILLALHLGLDEQTNEVIFMATQMHDTGFLNIDPKYLFEQTSLSHEMQREVCMEQLSQGQKFLDQVPRLSKRVGRAVLEHNERCDGSGWPSGIIGDQYSIEGQVVGLAVMLSEAYALKLKPRGYGPASLVAWAQVNQEGFDKSAIDAAVELLRQGAINCGRATQLPGEYVPALARYVAVVQAFSMHWMGCASELAESLLSVADTPETQRVDRLMNSLGNLLVNSGLCERTLRDWLLQVASDESVADYPEVEAISLMFESVLDKLKVIHWTMFEDSGRKGQALLDQCESLGSLLYDLPADHFEAMRTYNYILD